MIYEIYEFDGAKLPLYNPRQSPSAGQTDDPLIAVAGGGVYDRHGDGQLLPRSRSLRVRGVYDAGTTYWITEDGKFVVDDQDDYIILGDGPTVVSTQLDALTARQGKVGQLWRRPFRDMTRRQWVRARMISCVPSNRRRGIQSVEVEARFVSEMAAWRSETATVTSGVSSGGKVTLQPDVPGVAVRDAVLTIAASGTISNIRLWGGPLDEKIAWTWTGAISSGNTLTIDCGALTMLIGDADAYSFTPSADHLARSWLTLGPGSNPIGFDADGNYTATITHTDQWT